MCLSGCGSSSSFLRSAAAGAALHGKVRGGQQPVSGASIALYAAGASGPGAGAVNLLAGTAITTDDSGEFNITGDYTCPTASTQVYLVASGGDPGLAQGESNPALMMMVALGNCGDLSATTSVVINEVTTAAAAWALAQFLSTGGVVGASSTNAAGLANAFLVAQNLADAASGTASGAALPAGAVTEPAKINTLANVLSGCVNSDGGAACEPLFTAASSASGAPSNTLDAARNVVQNPGANVAAVFNASPAQGPFQPALTAAPNDWTISITYGGCVSGCGGLNYPTALAIDSLGNALVANYSGGVLSKFSPAGVPAAANGIAGKGLNDSYGIAIDGSDDVWVVNDQSVTAASNHHQGSVSEFSSAGVELSGYGFTSGGIYYPIAAAADPDGDIWIADYGSSSATLLAPGGTAISDGSGYATSDLPFTSAVAVDANHNAWFAVEGGVVRVTASGAASSFPCCSDPSGIAIDASGSLWVADYSASAVVELTAAGALANRTTLMAGKGGPQGIAVDGAGNVWAANYRGDTLAELSGSTAATLSPAQGYGLDAPLNEPYGVAIDASGNVWLSNYGADTVTQLVGLASPVCTPLLGPPVQP